jgi:hypothetical protein
MLPRASVSYEDIEPCPAAERAARCWAASVTLRIASAAQHRLLDGLVADRTPFG